MISVGSATGSCQMKKRSTNSNVIIVFQNVQVWLEELTDQSISCECLKYKEKTNVKGVCQYDPPTHLLDKSGNYNLSKLYSVLF